MVIGGPLLAVASYYAIRYFAEATPKDVDLNNRTTRQNIGLLGAPFALGLALGIVLAYMGAVRLAVGRRMDELDFGSITPLGLLYALGFAGVFALAGWILLIKMQFDPFGR